MLMFTLAISCLTTSNLPWFMDLTFQVPMQYCPLQHRTLLPSPITSTTGCCFCFGSVSSFFLELVLHWSPIAYWAPTNLGSSSVGVLSFCLFMLFMGFSRQENRSGLLFPSQCTTFYQNSPPRPVHLGWRTWHDSLFHWVRQGCGPCDQVVQFSIIVVFSLSALWWRRIRHLWKFPDGRDWLSGKLGLVPMGGAMLSKSSVQFPVDG